LPVDDRKATHLGVLTHPSVRCGNALAEFTPGGENSGPLPSRRGPGRSRRRRIARTLLGLPAVLVAVSAAHGAHPVRIQQVMAGANGDSSISFIELEFAYGTVPKWGPQGSETQSRAVLTFHDATGARVDTFAFPSDPPVGPLDPADQSHSVLIASQAFVEYTGLPADYVIAASPRAVDGMVCFTENPLNPGLDVNLCLSYGNYQGPTESDGCAPEVENGPPTQPLVIAFLLPVALGRISSSGPGEAFGCGQVNADFALRPAQPRNSAGDTATLPALSRVDQGRSLFARETFGGNGRTCASCHRPDDRFALSPEAIAELFATDPSDPLFVAEHDPALGELENACLMRMGHQRGLILENIDGFDRSPVFRGSPHLLNVGFTAPYGQSEGFADLRSFSISAIEQHLPKSLARNSDPAAGPVDFRVPRDFELEALEAYMNSLRFPADGDTSIDRMLDLAQRMGMDRAAIDRGRALVTGTARSASSATAAPSSRKRTAGSAWARATSPSTSEWHSAAKTRTTAVRAVRAIRVRPCPLNSGGSPRPPCSEWRTRPPTSTMALRRRCATPWRTTGRPSDSPRPSSSWKCRGSSSR
jgi:hypothetical protein